MPFRAHPFLSVAVGACVALTGCRGRDVAPATTEVTAVRVEPGRAEPHVVWATVIAQTSTLALTTTEDFVFFGDRANDALVAAPKRGGEPTPIAAPAPLGIAAVDSYIAWIAAPGDVLYRAPLGGAADVLPTSGTFTAIAAHGADVYAAEMTATGGALVRVREGDASTIAVLQSRPRALAVDDSGAYVLVDDAVLHVAHEGGEPRVVARGHVLSGLALTNDAVLTTTELPTSRALLRAPKDGAPSEVIVHSVRYAPIATFRDWVYYFDVDGSTILRAPVTGGPRTVVARAPELAWTVAMTVDASGVYVAIDKKNAGEVLAIPHPS